MNSQRTKRIAHGIYLWAQLQDLSMNDNSRNSSRVKREWEAWKRHNGMIAIEFVQKEQFNLFDRCNAFDWTNGLAAIKSIEAKPIYGLFANNELDQVCYSEQDARREAKDLVIMECEDVRIYKLTGPQSETCLDDMNENYFRMMKPFGRKGMTKMAEKYNVEITIIYKH